MRWESPHPRGSARECMRSASSVFRLRASRVAASTAEALFCRWKTPRTGPLVRQNSASAVEAATREALNENTEDADRIRPLLSLVGVAIPPHQCSSISHFQIATRSSTSAPSRH